jgi:hypothetical protein
VFVGKTILEAFCILDSLFLKAHQKDFLISFSPQICVGGSGKNFFSLSFGSILFELIQYEKPCHFKKTLESFWAMPYTK